MKKVICLIALVAMVSGCGGGSSYDRGYQDGYYGASKKGISESYKRGYADGIADAYDYDIGCQDKSDGKTPRYPSNVNYMDGYNAC